MGLIKKGEGYMTVKYDIIYGNKKIVFLKVGAAGSTRIKSQYTRMAQRIHNRLGATVICAANPEEAHIEKDEEAIRRVVAEMDLSDFEVYFIGASDGAYQNLSLAKRFPETVKLVGINTSLIDVSGFVQKLSVLPDVYKLLIYGTKDADSFEVIPVLSEMTDDMLSLKFIEGADHSFTGMVDEFIALSDEL